MKVYSDEHIERWAHVYVQRRVKRFHITLDQFLAQPEQMLARVDRFESAERGAPEPVEHHRERRAGFQLRQRGELLIQKLWHGSRRRNRADAPLPSRR